MGKNKNLNSIDFVSLLLNNYKKLGINENELVVLLMMNNFSQSGNNLFTQESFLPYTNFSNSQLDDIFVSLLSKNLIEYQLNNGKMQTNLNPLRERLYQELTKSILGNDIIQEEKKKQKLENLYKTFNTTFKRELAPFEINKIEDWLVSGYSVEQILYALRKAQSFGKLSMKNINTYLLQSKIEKDVEEEFSDYVKWGGLPQRFMQTDDMSKKTYLNDIYDSIIIKDVVQRFGVKNIDLLNRIATYLLTTPSQVFSPESIKKYLESTSRGVSLETLYNYLDYFVRANLISKADRYDIRGKRILTGKYKYYLTDLGFIHILSEGKKAQIGAYLENIVYNELIARGYNVNIGNIHNGEIDFIATRFEEKIYIQVTYLLDDENVSEREFGAYKQIEDNYPKYVLSMDKFDFSQNGIIHKNIIDWLLEEK